MLKKRHTDVQPPNAGIDVLHPEIGQRCEWQEQDVVEEDEEKQVDDDLMMTKETKSTMLPEVAAGRRFTIDRAARTAKDCRTAPPLGESLFTNRRLRSVMDEVKDGAKRDGGSHT